MQPYDYDRLSVNVRPGKDLGAVDKAKFGKSILRTHKWHDAADQAASTMHEVTAWLDKVEPRLQDNARYKECRAEQWWKRRQRA